MGFIDKKQLGKRLAIIREAEGLSARQFAASVGADQSYYSKAERGSGLSNEILDNIAQKYGYRKDWLLLGISPQKEGQDTPNKNDTTEKQTNKKIKRAYVEAFATLH